MATISNCLHFWLDRWSAKQWFLLCFLTLCFLNLCFLTYTQRKVGLIWLLGGLANSGYLFDVGITGQGMNPPCNFPGEIQYFNVVSHLSNGMNGSLHHEKVSNSAF
jgi:hypothetical protein